MDDTLGDEALTTEWMIRLPSLVFSRELLCFHVQFYPFPCTEFVLNDIYSTQFPPKNLQIVKGFTEFQNENNTIVVVL
jgi:hypothetical protein